jgi:superfamily I DNA/RNA helicase
LKELRAEDDSVSYWKLMCDEPRTLVDQKNTEALTNFVHFIHGLSRYKSLPPAEALKTILGLLKVGDHFAETETPDNDPIENLSALVKMAQKHSSIKEFLDYTRRASAASKSKKGVALSTCHSAKGMEFSKVFLVGCQEGLMPHSKATDLQEEVNIYFVACSRAERELVITYSGIPSPFLKGTFDADAAPRP